MLICGICVALGGTTVGDGWPALGGRTCADAAPTAAKTATAELPSSNSFRSNLNMLSPPKVDKDANDKLTRMEWRDPHDRGRADARMDRALAVSAVNPRNGIRAGDRLRPVCQAWGGPRALNGTWSNDAGSLAANDHGNISVNRRGGRIIARIGSTSVLTRLIFAQMAQKSPARPAGFFCGDDGAVSAAASPVSAAAHAAEPPLNLPTCTWPNERKS
jgi:hypothetical protein